MFRRLVAALAIALASSTASAETWPQLKDRITKALMSHDPKSVKFVSDYALRMPLYSTATLLEAATEDDGKLNYALDTDVWYFRTNSTWYPRLGENILTLGNGGTFSNATNSAFIWAENSEDMKLAFTSNLGTFSSSTGATFAFTPAVTFTDAVTASSTLTVTGDVTLNGGSGAMTVNGPIASGPWFEVSFNEGASKGVSLYSPLAAAYATTADAVNVLAYGQQWRFAFVTNTTVTGTITPAGTATGLDLNAGSPGNSDEWTMTAGMSPSNVGGMIIPGTTPAGSACATLNATTVTEAAGLWLLLTTPGAHVDLASADPNYTSYAGIGIVQGDIKVSDNTTGATDTQDNATNGVSATLCILWSASGVITYTNGGSAPTATDAHTLADGVPHVVRIQGLNHTGTEAPMNAVSLSVLPQ
mgnify:CR=1 FL=1